MSDSHEEPVASVALPGDLEEWLDERATALDLEREELLVQLLSAYRASERLEGELRDPIADAVDQRLDAATDAVVDRLDRRIEELDDEFQSKIVDVRERVVQVKKEADAKAATGHTHEELGEVERLATTVDALAEDVDALEERHDSAIDEVQADLAALRTDLEEELATAADERAALDDELSDATDKLRRVAWVVSDLKDDVGADDAHENAVARIKRAAAREGVSSATCDSCGEAVEVALLTAPECPHCDATVSDVRPTGGIFRKKARLVAAAQLESGQEDGSP